MAARCKLQLMTFAGLEIIFGPLERESRLDLQFELKLFVLMIIQWNWLDGPKWNWPLVCDACPAANLISGASYFIRAASQSWEWMQLDIHEPAESIWSADYSEFVIGRVEREMDTKITRWKQQRYHCERQDLATSVWGIQMSWVANSIASSPTQTQLFDLDSAARWLANLRLIWFNVGASKFEEFVYKFGHLPFQFALFGGALVHSRFNWRQQ